MTKYIFVTGGVVSGLGKGVSAASIGNLLKHRGFKIFVLKLDPYLNIDPGVMSPYEHGEVYVTADGGETDLDLGHYERFIDVELSKDSNYTSGKIFSNLFTQERNGNFLGKTVQLIPHFTNEILNTIEKIATKHKPDFMIVEIGGTIGDIESNSFIYAMAELALAKPDRFFLVHVTYVIFLEASNEFKSKPTQVSINSLRSFGISPNLVLLRNSKMVPDNIVEKIAKKSVLNKDYVISVPDMKNIYEAPLYFESQNIAQIILSHFKIKDIEPDLSKWNKLVDSIKKPKAYKAKILMVGKYVEFLDAYKSIIEAFKFSSYEENIDLKMDWVDSSKLELTNLDEFLKGYDGVVILPGFGIRGWEQKVRIAQYTRENKIPTFGICLGFQAMSVAHARMKGIKNANSREFANDKNDETYILDLIQGKAKDKNLGGTLRLGNYTTTIKENTLAKKIYQKDQVIERHRHRYEINSKYIDLLEDEEFVFSGIWNEGKLAEICEVKNHPFYLGVQYHPEFTSRPLKPNPLFTSFLRVLIKNN